MPQRTRIVPVPSIPDPLQIVGDITGTAESIVLPSVDSAAAVARPKDVSHLWVEDEYEELIKEQVSLWESAADVAARTPNTRRAGLELRATELSHAVAGSRDLLDDARERYQQAHTVLAPYRRRAVGSKPWYQVAKGIIFVGDLAGFATAAIWLGELPVIAFTLAASAAAATVVAGLVGTDYSDIRHRMLRARAPEELTDSERTFAHLFSKDNAGAQIVKRVLLLSLATALLVGVGIGALRATVDDPIVGILFAGIAFAVAGGSFLVSYAGADEIAALIDLYRTAFLAAQKRHLELAAATHWREWAEHAAEDASLRAEFTARGTAATQHMRALKWRILRNNPSIAGHGPQASDTTVGRTPRHTERKP